MGRKYEIIVWGATGFTGSLVCEHIASNYHGTLKWAVAGRNKQKLEQVVRGLSQFNSACTLDSVPIIIADSNNQESLDKMVQQTDVLMNMAGPYAVHGSKVVDACVRFATHCCDITGETYWIKEMITKYHEQASSKKVRIVSCCGFDSIPGDLCAMVAAQEMRKRHKLPCGRITGYYSVAGGPSGGTLESMAKFREISRETHRMIKDPYCLNPPGVGGPDVRDPKPSFEYNKELAQYTAFFIMEGINTRIVRRSNALLSQAYGRGMSYTEKALRRSYLDALLNHLLFFLFAIVLFTPWLRKRILPAPGKGPSRESMMASPWSIRLIAKADQPEGTGGQAPKVEVKMGSGRHGGYYETARFVLECALCLVRDMDQLTPERAGGFGVLEGGCLTPASAFGQVAVDRLEKAGFKITAGPASG